uniref:zinc finger protein Xfin-like n=1 Tax=Oncorhynchus gorbuscha TaxID=8017 RepID=UPI001EAF6CAB|nr:zinc finger protein Xfin-like [Oncorhynchus gorbuscha]XP_046171494.1 zinc finger protein Xfin-like [Oncorhynchus gorbuscha]
MDYVSSAEPDVDAFICTECGDGFRRYLDLVKHITVHERLRTYERTDSFSLDSLPNGFQVPREYALHENGTFIVVDRSGPSNNPSVKQPSSTPSPYQNSKTIVPTSKPAKTDLRVNTVSHSQCRSVSPLKQYRCETCGKSFNNKLSLQHHQQYRNLEQGFKCTLCCKIFTDKERLREHLQEHAHEIFYCCDQCGKRFLKQETLYDHQKEQHGSLGFKQMGKSDNSQENIIQKTYPCKKCNLCFFWLSDMQSHLLSHSKDKPLSVNSSSKIEQQSQKDELSHTIEYSDSTPTDVTKQYSSGTPTTDVTKQYSSGTPTTDVTKQYSSGTPTTDVTKQYSSGTPTTDVTKQYSSGTPTTDVTKQYSSGTPTTDVTKQYSSGTPTTDVTKQYSSGTPTTDVTKQYSSGTPTTDVTKQYSSGTPTTDVTKQYSSGTPTTDVTKQYSSDATVDVKTQNGKSDSKTPSSFRPYRCGLCGDRFQQLTDLKEHHLTHQTQEEIDKLNKDSESQRVVKKWQRYTRIECIVTKPPARKGGRPPLYKKGSGTKLHPCKHCHRVFSHSSSLSRHNRSHKGTLHTCVLCGKHFPQRCDVRRHIAMYHKPELEKKPSLKYLALHSKPDGGSQLNSDVLEQNVSYKIKPKKSLDSVVTELDSDNGEDQQTTSTGEVSAAPKVRRNYKCDQCGKKFGLLCVYQRHLRYHKREPGSEMVKCPHCPSRFRSSSALGRHLEIHPSQSRGEMDMEGRASPTADSNPDLDSDQDNVKDLVGHGDIDDVMGGNGEKIGPAEVLYECTECTETFSSLQKFLKHQSSHGSDNLG